MVRLSATRRRCRRPTGLRNSWVRASKSKRGFDPGSEKTGKSSVFRPVFVIREHVFRVHAVTFASLASSPSDWSKRLTVGWRILWLKCSVESASSSGPSPCGLGNGFPLERGLLPLERSLIAASASGHLRRRSGDASGYQYTVGISACRNGRDQKHPPGRSRHYPGRQRQRLRGAQARTRRRGNHGARVFPALRLYGHSSKDD